MPIGVYKRTKEHIAKMKIYGFQKGHPYGKRFEKGQIGLLSPAWKGGKPNCNVCNVLVKSVYAKYCNKCKPNRGEKHYRWIKDRTQIKKQTERNNPNDKQWKLAVYKRDNFKCRITDENCKGRIEAHHILSWNKYPELRFIINNGITLCHFHHPRKRVDEINLSPYFKKLVAELN